ncbi:MAG: alpha/beta fold hydrolase [Acidimicrobiales bacterium]
MSAPTFVLVHGGWGGAWCWRDLGHELDALTVAWTALDLPSAHDPSGERNLDDDADALVDHARDLGPVVLVGHSYGGAVVAQAASRLPGLESLVFVAAYVTVPGESVTECARRAPARTVLDHAIVTDGPLLRLDEDLAGDALYGRCEDHVRTWAVSMLGTQTKASFRAARHGSDPSVPRRYVKCLDDESVHAVVQDEMAGRCDEYAEIDADHSPFLSAPARLARVITVTDSGV